MPRYMVERNFQDGLRIPLTDEGAAACAAVVETNANRGVTWVHSYVSEDLRKTYCIYDAPTPDAIRESAHDANLPIENITLVRVLDPYFYRG
jgi:predicted amidohydrolase YtcJ